MTTKRLPIIAEAGFSFVRFVVGAVVLGFILWGPGALQAAGLKCEKPRCEYLENPMGIDTKVPRLSWIVTSSERGETQTGCQILVASTEAKLRAGQGDLWDTGKMATDETTQVAYGGKPLVSREMCFWKVRSWERDGKAGEWSAVARWQIGLLNGSDWSARWISAEDHSIAAAPGLVIQRATYESTDGGGSADVTAVVARQITNNRVRLVVNNTNLGGDPAPNHVKRLRVEYEVAGQGSEREVEEGQIFAIPDEASAVPYLRKTFALNSRVQRAVLYATALGLYEVDLNGHRVGDHILAPDWTDYRKRVRYQAYDVTALVKPGDNAMAALLANGWYSGHIGLGGFQFFGKEPAFFAQLEVTYADGRTERIVTDGSWRFHASPILASDFMLGEDYDARQEVKQWDEAGLDDSQWQPVTTRDETILLDGQVMEPVREITELSPRKVTEVAPGRWVYDLGQNMVGVVRLKVSAPAGTKVTLRHAEMLNPDGTLYTQNLRRALSEDHYITRGGGLETWQPRFTFHGFRYVEVSGLRSPPGKNAVTGIVIASDDPRAGEFSCSDPLLNQLQSNIQWGQRGNYISIPTDCPQRDERLGWMGDAEVFIRTATYNADVAAFFTKWLVDVDDGQSPAGAFSDVSPKTTDDSGVPAWGDAGVICPWTIYQAYGDKRILEEHLPAMIRWIEFLRQHSDGFIRDRDRGHDYGDWLAIGADTSKELIGTAYFAYSTHLVAQSCQALGRTDEAAQYEQLFRDIKAAFDKKYISADGHMPGNTQCDYAMALKFDLVPDDLKAKAAQYLVDDIKAKGGHLSTGFVGVSYLLPDLTEAGQADTAYRLLLQDTFPSWLFSVKQGATTIWERWDGWTPEKGFQNPSMNSFNHYSLGSCGEYLFGGIGGIQPASPGYKNIIIDPVIQKGLTWANTRFESVHGTIATAWQTEGKRLVLRVVIPANTTATVFIPASAANAVTEDGRPLGKSPQVKYIRQEDGKAVLEAGSGVYNFVSVMN